MSLRRLILITISCLSGFSYALDLELTQGMNSALPIGLGDFGYESSARELKDIIAGDLNLSGQFRIISPSSAGSQMSLWKAAGADNVVLGEVNQIGNNRYAVSFKLYDAVSQNSILLSNSYQVGGEQIRSLAHHISDLIYEKLTGEKGIFSTRIAYVSVQRSAQQSRYSLEVADADGYNPQSLMVSPEPIMSPSWSPDGRQIAFVSFEKRKAQIYTIALETGKRRLITDFTGINGAPSWSPDGRQLAVVLSKGGSSKIYLIDLNDGNLKQITFGEAIDTEPRFSPDGQYLLFTSGRGGSPQIYRLSLNSGSIQRMTFEGNYNARASYTPDQKYIVMLHREGRAFNIAVQDAANGRVDVVSASGSASDESPSVSPNSRLVLYATRENDKGVLGIVSLDGRIRMRIPSKNGDVQDPSWSPFLH